jgi:hypothetical protein
MRGIALVACVFLLGCSDRRTRVQAFGKEKSPRVAAWLTGGEIQVAGKPAKVLFESVDSIMIDPGRQTFQHEGFWNIEVVPGRRAVHFTFEYDGKLSPVDAVLHLEPGVEYVFAPRFVNGKLLQGWAERPKPSEPPSR